MIYLDSNLLIYLHENSRFSGRVQRVIGNNEHVVVCISPLVKAECLVGLAKHNNAELEAAYLRVFDSFKQLPIRESTFLQAARSRGSTGLKLPDALHLACAQENGCVALWTNDDRMSVAAPGYAVNILK